MMYNKINKLQYLLFKVEEFNVFEINIPEINVKFN